MTNSSPNMDWVNNTPIEEPTNYDYELDNLLENYGFQRILIGNEDYLIYKHPKTKIRVEFCNLNIKDMYCVFPFGEDEYYTNNSKGSLIEVDTLDEVKQILAKHKIIK